MRKYQPFHSAPAGFCSEPHAHGSHSVVELNSAAPHYVVKMHEYITDCDEWLHVLNEVTIHNLAARLGIAPRISRVWHQGSRVCVEMERGTPMHKVMHKLSPSRLPEFVRHTVAQTADHLITLHKQGVTHGDVYADNIILGHDNSIKLTDFGLSAFWDVKMPVNSGGQDTQKPPVRCHLSSANKKRSLSLIHI